MPQLHFPPTFIPPRNKDLIGGTPHTCGRNRGDHAYDVSASITDDHITDTPRHYDVVDAIYTYGLVDAIRDIRGYDSSSVVPVFVSSKCAHHKFACSYDYIVEECHGVCCAARGRGILVPLLRDEAQQHIEAGYVVTNGMLEVDPVTNECPHRTDVGLCDAHDTGLKLFGCIASPFTLNKTNSVIMRHRYYTLKCHGHGRPGYEVFRPSLDILFGYTEAARICAILDHETEEKIPASMPLQSFRNLRYLDRIRLDKIARDNNRFHV